MSEPFIGEISMFAGNFPPRNWAMCDGQLLPISQNTALFSLFGTYYGGDGRTTFALPELRGRIPVGQGRGPGLSDRRLGERAGVEQVTLNANELPSHTHSVRASSAAASGKDPAGGVPAVAQNYAGGGTVEMSSQAVTNTGGGAMTPHNNVEPFLCIAFIVCLAGIYPSRS